MAADELVAERVSVSFGCVNALTEASLRLNVGEAVGLIGPNGAGKTTLLNVLSGFTKSSTGSVLLGGRVLDDLMPRKRARLGLYRTFQGLRLFPFLSVRENVELAATAAGASRREASRRATEILGQLEIQEYAERACSTLPQGTAQRVGLARALAPRPKFLLLDEPAAGLSDPESDGLALVVKSAARSGTGVLVVEHDLRFVDHVCERLYVLTGGVPIFDGALADAFADPLVQQAYLGAPLVREQRTDSGIGDG